MTGRPARVAWGRGAAAVAVALVLAVTWPAATRATAAGTTPSTARVPARVPGALAAAATAAEADTTLDDFLDDLSDSTDAYFGASAAPLDTAGLDSARAWAFEHPGRDRDRGQWRPRFAPSLGFSRVDGPVYGGTMMVGQARRRGQLDGNLAWASGPNEVLGYGQFSKVIRRGETAWTLRLRAGRETSNMDRDRTGAHFAALRAFVNGNDRRSYYRRDGAQVEAERIGARYNLALAYRDQLERPLVTTATWNLLGKEPKRVDNHPAALGRARELSFGALWRVPRSRVVVGAGYQSSSAALNSDFEYRRLLLAGGADFGLGPYLSLVPQAAYGSLTGQALPQQSFYFGGPSSLRSVSTQSLGGARMALARLDLIGIPDLLELARIPHPAMFPIQGGLFAAVGAVWGSDPFGGPDRRGGDWPDVEEWKTEAGFSLLYQPGIPDATGFLRMNVAWALGPKRDEDRVTVSYSRALDLLSPFDR